MSLLEMIVVAWCLLVCASDMLARRIPNSLTVGASLFAIAHLLLTGQTILGMEWQSALIGAAASLILTVPAYATRILGAGDVKLFLAIGLIGGWYLALFTYVLASIITVWVGVTCLVYSRIAHHQTKPGRWIPFGAALSAGLLLAMGVTK